MNYILNTNKYRNLTLSFWISTIMYFCIPQPLLAQFTVETQWATDVGVGAQGNWIGDFNGDRLADIASYAGNGVWNVSLSNGNGFGTSTLWASGQGIGSPNSNFFVGDFNGDGLCDRATIFNDGVCYVALAKQRLDGTFYFDLESQWTLNLFSGSQGRYIGDFNGDGLADVASYAGNGVWNVSLSNGNGFGTSTPWASGQGIGTSEFYFGDFDGDGKCDKVSFFSNGQWWVALSTETSFDLEFLWASDQGIGCQGHWIGDFNGDSKADKLNYQGNGNWWVALSAGNSFGLETQWASSQGVGVPTSQLFAGDFNGDGYCDRATYFPSGEWWVATSNIQSARITGIYFTNWYTNGSHPGYAWSYGWENTRRDSLKTPITGYGSEAVTGIYNSVDTAIIRRQINAMKASGIDLIIVDFTNGFYTDVNNVTGYIRDATNKLFQVMNSLPPQNRIKIALGLGYEFWGPRLSNAARLETPYWPGWPTKKIQEATAFDRIWNEYANHPIYKNIYFSYLGKPLVIAWLNDGTDDPPVDTDGTRYSLWHDNRFTIKNSVYWSATWSFQSTDPNEYVFHNGQDTRYPGWGWGSLYGGTVNLTDNFTYAPPKFTRNPPLPYNAECMTVMPGAWMYWTSISSNVDRDTVNGMGRSSGVYYINSWKEIIKDSPRIVMIAGWNDWNKETAIEQCTGPNGWKDYFGNNQPDWYLQITKAYSQIFKTETLPIGVYVREDEVSNSPVYFWNGSCLETFPSNHKPVQKPVIKLPTNWLQLHGYTQICPPEGDDSEGDIEVTSYPNPFNPTVTISISIPVTGTVKLSVYNVLGQEVASLINETLEKGTHKVGWSANNYASGIYFYRVSYNKTLLTKKILLLK